MDTTDTAVELSPLTTANAERLVAAAVAAAHPADVMPAGHDSWSPAARAAYRAFLDGQLADAATVSYLVCAGDAVAGVIRLRGVDAATAETGIWLGREARGRGIGKAAVLAVLEAARGLGYRVVVAETTADNAAAVGLLATCGAAIQADPEEAGTGKTGPEGGTGNAGTGKAGTGKVTAEIAVPLGAVHDAGGTRVMVYAADAPVLARVDDVLDNVIAPTYGAAVEWVALPVGRLTPEFFDLSTRLAGEVLQKLVNYQLGVAIVGDIGEHLARSGALTDFVRESNRGRHVWFVADLAELRRRLGPRG
ncbi:GNAT family N-acetyltransferase [Actinokineospora sp. 24-640]